MRVFSNERLRCGRTRDTDRSETAVRALNECDESYTSILNVVEFRSVLAKKKAFERGRIDRIEDRVVRKNTVVFPDASDIVAANEYRAETLLYPMDALIFAAAESVEAPLVSFDGELIDQAAIEPVTLLGMD